MSSRDLKLNCFQILSCVLAVKINLLLTCAYLKINQKNILVLFYVQLKQKKIFWCSFTCCNREWQRCLVRFYIIRQRWTTYNLDIHVCQHRTIFFRQLKKNQFLVIHIFMPIFMVIIIMLPCEPMVHGCKEPCWNKHPSKFISINAQFNNELNWYLF